MTLTPTRARSLLATSHRRNDPPAVIADRRRDLAAANIAAAIDRALSTAPPLSDEQAEALAARLRGATS